MIAPSSSTQYRLRLIMTSMALRAPQSGDQIGCCLDAPDAIPLGSTRAGQQQLDGHNLPLSQFTLREA